MCLIGPALNIRWRVVTGLGGISRYRIGLNNRCYALGEVAYRSRFSDVLVTLGITADLEVPEVGMSGGRRRLCYAALPYIGYPGTLTIRINSDTIDKLRIGR